MKTNLRDLSLHELIDNYIKISQKQGEALLDDDTRVYNRLYEKVSLIDEELRSRGTDARLMLTPLLEHPNLQVQYNAAADLLGILRDAARAALWNIKETDYGPYRLRAGMTLRALDDGSFDPMG